VSLSLHVDVERWRTHQAGVLAGLPGLVHVVKGNGYGFSRSRLAAEAGVLGARTVAVGEPEEVEEVAARFPGDVLVLAPWRPDEPVPADGVVRTVSHLDALRAIAGTGARIVIECRTTMRRHGLLPAELSEAAALLDGLRVEGFALHLPIARSASTLWVSHLDAVGLAAVAQRLPDVTLRPRVGTALWLGDRGAFRATATVLDAHPLSPGDRYGYRQRRAVRACTLLVVSGGTAHGVGLEAPKPMTGVTSRARLLAAAGIGATGWALSPFHVAGRQRWFAEPPHMQVSMLLLPRSVSVPALGDEVDVDVRMTTTYVDRVVEQ
jgi:alanine racemase-like protein